MPKAGSRMKKSGVAAAVAPLTASQVSDKLMELWPKAVDVMRSPDNSNWYAVVFDGERNLPTQQQYNAARNIIGVKDLHGTTGEGELSWINVELDSNVTKNF